MKNYFRFVWECALSLPNTKYRSHKRHTIWLLFSTTLFPLHMFANYFLFLLDDLLRPGIKRTKITNPLFIIGNFRSGTTFLHRLLHKDSASFSAGTGGEIFFTPSFHSRQIVRGLRIIDTALGAPIHRLLSRIEHRIFGDIHSHKLGRNEPEEDESFYIHNFSSTFIGFASPSVFSYEKYFSYDASLPAKTRRRDMNYFESCIKRHLYFHRNSSHYLSKSPTFTPRCRSILEKFPDARFIYMLRDPQEVLPSLLSWFGDVWGFLQKKDTPFPFPEFIVKFSKDWTIHALEILGKFPKEQVKIVKYSDMIRMPVETVQEIYEWLALPMSEEFQKILLQTRSEMKQHKHAQYKQSSVFFNFDSIQREFSPVYKRLSQD